MKLGTVVVFKLVRLFVIFFATGGTAQSGVTCRKCLDNKNRTTTGDSTKHNKPDERDLIVSRHWHFQLPSFPLIDRG